jgi:hypothetical protein
MRKWKWKNSGLGDDGKKEWHANNYKDQLSFFHFRCYSSVFVITPGSVFDP